MNNNEFPKISIITPSYNQGQYLEDTILSIVNQNYPNLEYIIIDGGSTDDSVEIIKRYEQLVSYWVSEKDEGQANAINKGLKLAKGEIIGWLNSDDTYTNNVLFDIARIFKNKEISWFAGAVYNFREKSDYTEIITQQSSNNIIDWLTHKTAIHQPGVFWRKSVQDKVGLLKENYHYTFDWEYWCRFVIHGFFPKIDNELVVANFRLHEESKTSSEWHKFLKEFSQLASEQIENVDLSQSDIKQLKAYKINEEYKYLKKRVFSQLANANFLKPWKSVAKFLMQNPSCIFKAGTISLIIKTYLIYPIFISTKHLFKNK